MSVKNLSVCLMWYFTRIVRLTIFSYKVMSNSLATNRCMLLTLFATNDGISPTNRFGLAFVFLVFSIQILCLYVNQQTHGEKHRKCNGYTNHAEWPGYLREDQSRPVLLYLLLKSSIQVSGYQVISWWRRSSGIRVSGHG